MSGSAVAQNGMTQSEFEAFCDSAGMVFTMPEGYHSVEVKDNRDLYYAFAIANEDSSMEVRFTVWPLDDILKEYEESLEDSNRIMVPPNNIYMGRVEANVLNMTGGEMYNIGPFPPNAVKKEFAADAGGSCFLEFNCEFGKGFKYGQFVYLHKDDVADAIITYMSNDKSTHSDLMMEAFYALKFKEK